jgi:hypothetical protein
MGLEPFNRERLISPQSWQLNVLHMTSPQPHAALVHVPSLENKEHKGNICAKNEYTYVSEISQKIGATRLKRNGASRVPNMR